MKIQDLLMLSRATDGSFTRMYHDVQLYPLVMTIQVLYDMTVTKLLWDFKQF